MHISSVCLTRGCCDNVASKMKTYELNDRDTMLITV